MVAVAQLAAYDFADAKKTIGLFNDPENVLVANLRLARYQAKAGVYAEAEETLGKVAAATEDEKKAKEDTRQMIASYKTAGQKEPPRQKQGTCYESLRRVSTIFSDSGFKLDNVAQAEIAEKAADETKGAGNKATAWRNIAWAYYDMRNVDKKNLERCRRAIDKSLQNAEDIPDGLGNSYSRAVALASAANLYLELGETDLAKQAVKKAGAVNLDADMLGGLSSFTTTPLLIAVLVRVGDVDGAREIADKLQKTVDKEKADAPSFGSADIAWSYWATACTLEGKTASVERQLEKTDNARTKAVLCAGVATGLLELQQRPANKKP
jgi:tetratricopeptide (TPR) repeat protein